MKDNGYYSFDKPIKSSAMKIIRSITSDADFSNVETELATLTALVEAKRKVLYQSLDATPYLNQYFNGSSPEERIKIAEELAEQILGILNIAMMQHNYLSRDEVDFYIRLLEFFRNVTHIDDPEEDNEDVRDINVLYTTEHDNSNIQYLMMLEHREVIKALGRKCKLLSDANVETLLMLFSDLKTKNGLEKVRIEWKGNLKSLTTVLVVLYEIKILEAEYGDEKCKTERPKGEPVINNGTRPNFWKLITENFEIKIGKHSSTTVHRRCKSAYEDLENIIMKVRKVMIDARKTELENEYVFRYYMKNRARFNYEAKYLDMDVVKLIYEELNKN